MAAPPKWAQDLVLRVALDEGRDDLPKLTWHRSRSRVDLSWYPASYAERRHPDLMTGERRTAPSGNPQVRVRFTRQPHEHSSGRAWQSGRIHVTAGTDRKDQKLVLLHELAHWLTPKDHHSPRFWDKAWELYRRYRVPLRYARIREGNYRKGALVAANRRPRERRPTDT